MPGNRNAIRVLFFLGILALCAVIAVFSFSAGNVSGVEAQARREVRLAVKNHGLALDRGDIETAAHFETVILWNMLVPLRSHIGSDSFYKVDWLPDGTVLTEVYTRSKESDSWSDLREYFQKEHGPLDTHRSKEK